MNTTLAKAKALRPFAEKLVTLAVKSHTAVDAAGRLHYRRLVIARLRSEEAAKELFDVKAPEFVNRHGGYTHIDKLVPRIGDGAKMAIIELIYADDNGYAKSRRRRKSPGRAKAVSAKAGDASIVQTTAEPGAALEKVGEKAKPRSGSQEVADE
jgi:large subunit ribosomal protein L17